MKKLSEETQATIILWLMCIGLALVVVAIVLSGEAKAQEPLVNARNTETGITPAKIPLDFVVNFLPPQLVAEKYGPLPKWAIFGEVIGCNGGSETVHFGEGDVIYTLRKNQGLQAFSIQDAFSLVSNSQSASVKNKVTGYVRAAAQSAIELKASGIIAGGNATGAGIVIGAEAVNIVLPNLQGTLNLKQAIQYSKDGMSALMAIPAGRCAAPMSVLFAVPACAPMAAKCTVPATSSFPLSVAPDRK